MDTSVGARGKALSDQDESPADPFREISPLVRSRRWPLHLHRVDANRVRHRNATAAGTLPCEPIGRYRQAGMHLNRVPRHSSIDHERHGSEAHRLRSAYEIRNRSFSDETRPQNKASLERVA